MGKITGFLEKGDHDSGGRRPTAGPGKPSRKLSAVACTLAVCLLVAAAPVAAKAYPANVYFHFTDGHGNDFRIPLAVPGLTECNQAKLAVMAKNMQKHDPMAAGWTYVRTECRAPRR